MNKDEIEAKFYLRDRPAYIARLQAAGAVLEHPRMLEQNLRFDLPDGSLMAQKNVLRLRQDRAALLTFKGPTRPQQGVAVRTEIQFEVSDFDAARGLLEALGYQVVVMYEKYREDYFLGDVLITVDEMPFGLFTELEGPSVEAVQEAAHRLGLNWEARGAAGYLELFDRLKKARGLPLQHLSFAEVGGLGVRPEELGMIPAD